MSCRGPSGRGVKSASHAPHNTRVAGRAWRLTDQLGADTYDRDGDDLAARGLYLDARPWQASAFSVSLIAP